MITRNFSPSRRRPDFLTMLLSALVAALTSLSSPAQEVIYQEGFNTDGEGTRYTVEGGEVYELDRILSELDPATQQAGPVYWARSSDVSFVGVPAPTPARRAILAWHHTIAADAVTPEFLAFFDSLVDWMTEGKNNARVLFSPPMAGEGDTVLADRLAANGHTVLEDDEGADPPAADTIDLVIKSSSGGSNPSRFATYAAPVISYSATDHDDLLVSSIGETLTTELGPIRITAPEHPASGGQTEPAVFVTGEQSFDMPGAVLPQGSTTVAVFERVVPAAVSSLAEADALADGSAPSTTQTGTILVADLAAAGDPAAGSFTDDYAVPGDPSGGFAVVGRGQLTADFPETYSLALGTDDGGRLRIDFDQNGLTADDDVIVVDSTGAFRYTTADVEFPAGTFDFEWVSFNASGAFGSELAVAIAFGGGAPTPVDTLEWEPLFFGSINVRLVGDISVTTYVPDAPPVTEQRPFLVVLEGPEDGGSVFGGGPISGEEGAAFFAGAGLNKYDTGTGATKALQLNPINVAGKENLKLRIAVAATFLDFETSDFLDVLVDPDGSGPAEFMQLIHFTAPSGNDKFFNDVATHPENPTQLTLQLQDVTYDLPEGATQLVVRVEAETTWWNEIVAFDDIRILSGAAAVDPTVAIERNGNVVQVTFAGALESATSVTGPWTAVAGAVSPMTVQTDEGARFYRAVSP